MKKRTEVSVLVMVASFLALMAISMPVSAQIQNATVTIGDIILAPQTSATIPITITEATTWFCSADINLTYDKTVVQVTAVGDGDFDNVTSNITDGRVIMVVWGDDNLLAPATVATITLKAIGDPGECSPLILEGSVSQNHGTGFHNTWFNNGSVCIIQGVPVFNTTGMVALVGLLALVLVVTIRRRR